MKLNPLNLNFGFGHFGDRISPYKGLPFWGDLGLGHTQPGRPPARGKGLRVRGRHAEAKVIDLIADALIFRSVNCFGKSLRG